MNKKHLIIIIIAQSLIMFILFVYASVQRTLAKEALRDAERQKELALESKAESDKYRREAELQATIALELQKKL